MKKLLLISSFILVYIASFAQGAWQSQATSFQDVSSGIRNIVVVDTNIVWVTSYDGSGSNIPRHDYSKTVNGGTSWTAASVPTTANWDWAMLTAVDSSNAWAIFFNTGISPVGLGQIWHTNDGGTNWTQQGIGKFSTSGESFPNIIHFWDDSIGVVVGDPVNNSFEIYTTTNGGATWDSVPVANIPAPADANEAGWTTHLEVEGDTIWFDTNEGRVYRSVDFGHNWTVASTGLPAPNPGGTIDVDFYNSTNGIARYYNDTTITNSVVESTDGGATWTPITVVGNFFGADFESVPGVDSMYVSTGVSSVSGFTGSSYSLDGGHNWVDIETGTQRNALGIADSLTMWCGGFTSSPTADGIFKYIVINPVACNDPSVNPGVTTATDTALCGGDTLTVTSTGVVSPVNGTFSGVSWVISTADISGSPNPLLEASLVASYVFSFPAPSTSIRTFINDGTLIDGSVNLYQVYYWTPVVFANAVAATSPPVFLGDLTLDGACTFTGTSIAVDIIDPAICSLVGVNEVANVNHIAVYSSIVDKNTLDVLINSDTHGKVSIQLMDLTGRIVKEVNTYVSKGSNHELINVSDLSAGTYVIKADVNGNRATNKVVKY